MQAMSLSKTEVGIKTMTEVKVNDRARRRGRSIWAAPQQPPAPSL